MSAFAAVNPNSFLPSPVSSPVVIDPKRALGTLTADCVIEEAHVDRAMITRHPAEQGSTISDNVVDEPNEVTLTYGWSGGSPQNTASITLVGTAIAGSNTASASQTYNFSNPHFIQAVYQQLLSLKASKVPFAIYTGKRVYSNMLIESLATTTDASTENSLIVRIVCMQVIMVSTTIALLAVNPAQVANPQNNLAPAQRGTMQTTAGTLPSTSAFQGSLTTSAAQRFPFPVAK